MSEEWLPVLDWPSYEVSNLGRVRSIPRTITDQIGKVSLRPGVIRKQALQKHGYLQVGLSDRGRTRMKLVHVLVAEAFLGRRPEGLYVCHWDGVKTNNRPVNLRWGTRLENAADSIRHGTHPGTRKTHCPFDHSLTEPNLVPSNLKLGKRSCLSCSRARSYRHFHPELPLKDLADSYYAALTHQNKEAA